ncbi:MAG: tRNA (adenosine(37)-N6)-threonylcarbamoyltransferase complex ATPase subunit type 1 TsaE [Planctomycetes bacterium]|nr:tRNA (adenosine(37)-N6)-threonylcarbamoyltransferase complex ATPase subunit type 1 TsaE [Planctomycetota bacterium]
MGTLYLLSPTLESTIQIGRILGKCLPAGTFVALDGILGAGKTQFVKGIACGLDEGGWAGLRSPTFTLMLSYHGGRCVLHHIDFYRLNESPELPGEIIEAIENERAITVVEWADIWREVWPDRHVHVSFEIDDDTSKRHITLEYPDDMCPQLSRELDDFIKEPAEA